MKAILFLFLCLCFVQANAQWIDSFSDGDFSSNPTWTGNTADFIVNTNNQLQSNNTVANASFYLATESNLATMTVWEFKVNLSFNPSSANYVDVYVISAQQNLLSTTNNGYFIRLGGTDDEISLFKKTGTTETKIIDGLNGTLNSSNNNFSVRLIRNENNVFFLSRDLSGGSNFTLEGTSNDFTYTTSNFFGVLIKQSTASFFQRHFFDDFVVNNYVPDTEAPTLLSAIAINQTQLDVLFNEPVNTASATSLANYNVDHGIGFPTTANLDATNPALVHLIFSTPFPPRTNLILTATNIADLSGNILTNASTNFSWFVPFPYDILITEIMADPTPIVGLPDAEWIEIKNVSGFDINLNNWRIAKPTSQSGALPNYILKKDSFLVLSGTTAATVLNPITTTIGITSFPSLTNSGDLLMLKSPSGSTIHSVNYSDTWYKNALKKDGGWTLEMIDTNNPCNGENNWTASTNPIGGTPGKINSVAANNPDIISPELLRAYAMDSLNIVLVFSETVDSSSASNLGNYSISDGIGQPINISLSGLMNDRIALKLSNALQRNKVYTIQVNGISDCTGNTMSTSNARIGLYETIDSLEIILNEILFNPKPGGVDYIEVYNNSNQILSLHQLFLANRNTLNEPANITQVSNEPYLIFPKDYLVFTSSKSLLMRDHIAQNPKAIVEMNSLPSMNDTEGNIILMNQQGQIIDQLSYTDKWHFPLIDNKENVALERLNFDAATQDKSNWHSASSTSGYGTPTYKNSQTYASISFEGNFEINPKIISPNNDGRDDVAIIEYQLPEPGFVVNINVYDASGRLVKNLYKNNLLGISGKLSWDGLGDQNKKLNSGIYIFFIEIYRLNGDKQSFKKTIVLARTN